MNADEINWSTVIVSAILALITASGPIALSALLSRKGANKKLQLDETTVMLSGTDMQVKAYQDLLNRANVAVTKAEDNNTKLEGRVSELEEQKKDQDWQIVSLRDLVQSLIKTNNIVLTKEQQQIFDATQPMGAVRRMRRYMRPT